MRSRPFLSRLFALATLLAAAAAHAGVAYRLDTTHAVPGETVRISAVLFNDTSDTLSWAPQPKLVLQWRDDRGGAVRSLAYLDSPPGQVNIPVNNFVKMRWRAVVPKGLKGLQAVNIEGQPVLLALDTSPLEKSPVAGTPAAVPVVDAGAGSHTGAEPALPAEVVRAAGASPTVGPAADSHGRPATTPPTAFENFRNALSPYEPVYFDVGTKGGAKARFQVSFKYRLFTPDDPQHPSFKNHFYLGYTQTSLWDLASKSTPFIDTTYNPSLFWQKDALWQSGSKKWFAGLSTGVEHKSNGKSGADSRSLNDGFIEPQLNYRFDGGSTLSFAPRVKAYFATSDNPDYADYAGHVDWKLRWAQDNGLVLGALYRKGHGSRQSTELDAAWPLQRTFLHMNGYLHLQYFNGYGDTLLGYNQRSSSQVRIGLSLVP